MLAVELRAKLPEQRLSFHLPLLRRILHDARQRKLSPAPYGPITIGLEDRSQVLLEPGRPALTRRGQEPEPFAKVTDIRAIGVAVCDQVRGLRIQRRRLRVIPRSRFCDGANGGEQSAGPGMVQALAAGEDGWSKRFQGLPLTRVPLESLSEHIDVRGFQLPGERLLGFPSGAVSGLTAASMKADNPPTVPGYLRAIPRHRLARRSFVAWLIGGSVDCHSPLTAEYSRMSGG